MDDVYAAMDKGDSFYTQGEQSGKIAFVQRMKCPHCKTFKTLQSAPEATEENNLDNLPTGNTG